MNYPLSTGQVAELLATTEPQLAELVRRGRIRPAPVVLAGRRLWQESHLLQAARALGCDDHVQVPLGLGVEGVPDES